MAAEEPFRSGYSGTWTGLRLDHLAVCYVYRLKVAEAQFSDHNSPFT